MRPPLNCRNGFTLIELLTVVAIIGLLVAMLLPALGAAREMARRVQCQNRLKAVGLALRLYHEENDRYPPAAKNEWSWIARILPHLEFQWLYHEFDFSVDPFIPPNDQYTSVPIVTLTCPNDTRNDYIHIASTPISSQAFAHTNFVGTLSSGTSRGMFPREQGLRQVDVSDGSAQTIQVGERGIVVEGGHTHGWWVWGITGDTLLSAAASLRPGNESTHADAFHFWGHHPNGAQFLFVDGRVKELTYRIEPALFNALASRDTTDAIGTEY